MIPPNTHTPVPMKSLLVFLTLASCLHAQPMTDRVGKEELAERRAASSAGVTEMRPGASTEARVARPAKQSLITRSTILSDGTNWTLVPRGAVLHVPEDLDARVDVRPVGNLLPWRDFLTRNHAWIEAEEVSLRQAEGVKPLDEKRVAHWAKQDKIIIATHLRGPISVTVTTTKQETASN